MFLFASVFSTLLATMFLCMNRIHNDLLESVTDKFVANLVWAQLQAQQASTNIIQSGVLGRFWTSNLIIGNAMCLPMKTIWPTWTFYDQHIWPFIFSVPCIVIQLCDADQQNVHFSSHCFNSFPGVFYVIRASCVRHQEDHLYMQMVRFSRICVRYWAHLPSHLLDCLHKCMKNTP